MTSVMVVGGGGREHAIVWKLAQSQDVAAVVCVPGNGGTALLDKSKVKNVALPLSDFAAIADLARAEKSDLIVVGPDNPLADGIVDYLEGQGLTVFGPTREQARLEWSKTYAKQKMIDLGLPTARFYSTGSLEDALAFIAKAENSWARVVKADGLALGKGVFVCDNEDQVKEALRTIFGGGFGAAGEIVVLEEKLVGEELSLLCVSDGKTLLELGCAQDHKRRFAGDVGPNTGGMGAYTPVPLYDNAAVAARIRSEVLAPIGAALAGGRLSFKGVLFIGLMIDAAGAPYILEFNARLGDPETQAILPRLKSDLLPLLLSCTNGTLAGTVLNWSDMASVCISVVTREYPAKSSSGEPVTVEVSAAERRGEAIVFHAGTRLQALNGAETLVTAGGRVFSAVGLGKSMAEARQAAEDAVDKIHFETKDFRTDIGWRALEQCVSK
ncbi:MAG: phosphoribosylamine--glycine ligase [Cyanobacteria bacterium SZAS LIN-3]|nr:phosphoribosylamine--glycine ligase [Cyanobacteria bacterium SZAS LIN-3]